MLNILYIRTMKALNIFWVVGLFLLSGCISEPTNTNIPYKRVSFLIDTSLSGPDYTLHDGMGVMTRIYDTQHPARLSNNGGYGVCGVIVVRTLDNHLCAFDLCCPYQPQNKHTLQQTGVGDFFLQCPQCGSQFEVGNGTGRITKGPATQPLKYYRVEQRGGERYYVRNW